MRLLRAATLAAGLAALAGPPAPAQAARDWTQRATRQGSVLVVGYRSEAALASALRRFPAVVVRRLPELGAAEVRTILPPARFTASVRRLPGIGFVQRPQARERAAEPAVLTAADLAPAQWQWYATGHDRVPDWAARAAAQVTIAVIDTGADLAAPDLAAKSPETLDVATGSREVEDRHGHGTFVSSLAAGSATNGEGIAGSGGDAKLLVIRAGSGGDRFTDVDGARGILAAVERGARIINLSFGGPRTSPIERRAVAFAAARGVLLVAAAGNEGQRGNPVQYPAALLQKPGSKGAAALGLSVAASTAAGTRAAFSSAGSWISIAAPGESVFAAVSSFSSAAVYPRTPLPGSASGLYGFGSGTSYATPQVAGAAAIVWGANPTLTASEVAEILKRTARGGGRWTPGLGYGVIDVTAALELAVGTPAERSAAAG